MRGGVNAFLFTAALITTGCVTDSGKLDIRPLADPYAKATKAGSPAVAQGRGLLAVGSVGLAIEAFRKALIEQPDSIEALAGLAECYDQMGRHDLSQAKYEAALAIAPKDPTLLRTFAASLERQGRYAEAAELRGEADADAKAEAAALVQMAPAAPAPVQVAATAPLPTPAAPVEVKRSFAPEKAKPLQSTAQLGRTEWKFDTAVIPPPPEASASVTVKLPPPARAPKPAKIAAAPPLVEAPRIPAEPPVRAPAPRIAVAALRQIEAPAIFLTVPAIAEEQPVQVVEPQRGEPLKVASAAPPSVTVKLPPARPAAAVPAQRPDLPSIPLLVAEAVPAKAGPRLERMSLGEVALLTNSKAGWRTEAAQWKPIGAPARFVSLAELQASYSVRLLNAARHEGLAANTRLALNRDGWKKVSIGDAARTRARSLVLYSERTEQAARRLAARFGFWIAREARPGPLTVLLGRDWAARRQARA